jgi:protein ImuB
VAERWWSEDASRRAYLQVALADGSAVLVASRRGEWALEAVYD